VRNKLRQIFVSKEDQSFAYGRAVLIHFERATRACCLPLALLLLFIFTPGIWSKAAQPPQDPLITMMLAQPRIEIGSAVTAVSWFDPPVVQPGQLSFYRVTFNALEESIVWPNEVASPAGLILKPGARGQILQPTGPATEPRTTFSYRARASESGELTVPAFTVQVYGKSITVPAAKLNVVADTGLPRNTPQQLFVEVAETNLFVGQPTTVRILLPSSAAGMVQGLTQIQLVGQGFIMDQGAAHQKMENIVRDGNNVITFIHETMLIPVSAGALEFLAQGFTVNSRSLNAIAPAAGGPLMPQYVLVESEPVALNVRPLPKEGELPGFTGAIGTFSIDAPKLATNAVRVGDPIKLSVTVHAASFARLVAPPSPHVKDWQVMSATSAGEPAQMMQSRGMATFDYTLIPMTEQTHATPAIPFSCFDPNRAVYTDLTIPSVPVTVQPGRAPADAAAILQPDENRGNVEEELTLSALAPLPGHGAATLVPLQRQTWFLIVEVTPMLAFLGIWAWDRRRRYLEIHPQIMVRRRAKRALRKERRKLRRAATTHDFNAFADAAVTALRVGSAPHLPANPSALVGGDVLTVLADKESVIESEALVVRRVFSATDDSRFSLAPSNRAELLGLQPQLEEVLERLEARLQ
jgi:hypothetical protein